MFYYIYRISLNLKDKLKNVSINKLNSNSSDLFFNKKNESILEGNVDLTSNPLINAKVNFEIDLKYCFLFIETNHPTILDKSLEILEKYLNEEIGGELENFLPRVSKEHELICNSLDFDLKFFHDGEIVDSDIDENLEKKYSNYELDKDYSLIEADITLYNGINFYYLRKTLKIDDELKKEPILTRFKQVMA